MKSTVTLMVMILLGTGCANFPASTQSDNRAVQQEDNNKFGDWRVNCIYDEGRLLTQCKAETHGKIATQEREREQLPNPVLWVSWLKGEPKPARTICIFGQNYPVTGVGLQIDDNRPIQVGALNAAGCLVADSFLMKELREGKELVVTFVRWPWGQTKATFSLNKSNNSLNELDRLVAEQR